MIDAQAVVAHLEKLGNMASDEGGAQRIAGLAWVGEELGPLPVEQERDAAGNTWITLRGASERAVVLGSYLQARPGDDRLDSRLGLVTVLETMKALGKRFEGRLPCTLQAVVWADGGESAPATPVALPPRVAAYLELHVEPGEELKDAGTPLGVVTASGSDGAALFHPRLTALCDEAIRELTGTSATLASGPSRHAVEVARMGVPAAMMYVQALSGGAEGAAEGAAEKGTRLHLLQAAEAFGRWAEATVHLVAGDEVDLWAREQRVPHS